MQHAVLSAVSRLKNLPPQKRLPTAAALVAHTHARTRTQTEEEEGGEGGKENCSWREIRAKSWLGTAILAVEK